MKDHDFMSNSFKFILPFYGWLLKFQYYLSAIIRQKSDFNVFRKYHKHRVSPLCVSKIHHKHKPKKFPIILSANHQDNLTYETINTLSKEYKDNKTNDWKPADFPWELSFHFNQCVPLQHIHEGWTYICKIIYVIYF